MNRKDAPVILTNNNQLNFINFNGKDIELTNLCIKMKHININEFIRILFYFILFS